jgi:thymidylate kinase
MGKKILPPAPSSGPRIAIVGPCGAGKTTLAEQLQALGLQARQIAQEHSYVPAMWQILTRPDILIYLDASFVICSQRKRLDWTPADHAEQLRRLAHARAHCDIYVQSDWRTPEEVLQEVRQKLADGLLPDMKV